MLVFHVQELSRIVIRLLIANIVNYSFTKKCTKLKQSELKLLKPGEWECKNCCKNADLVTVKKRSHS